MAADRKFTDEAVEMNKCRTANTKKDERVRFELERASCVRTRDHRSWEGQHSRRRVRHMQ